MAEPDIVVPKLVMIESPFKGKDWDETQRNILYARLCVRDSLYQRGEFPYASHLLLTQTGLTDDTNPEQRDIGIRAGQALAARLDLRVICQDLEISKGMEYGIEAAERIGQPIEYRNLSQSMDLEAEIERLSKVKQYEFLNGMWF